MQESLHGLLAHNTGTSSIPVRPPSSPSPSFSLPLPLSLSGLGPPPQNSASFNSRQYFTRTAVTVVDPSRPRYTKTPAGAPQPSSSELHSLSPPTVIVPSSAAAFAGFFFFLSLSRPPTSRHPRPLSAPRSLLCSPVNKCHAGAGGSASSIRNDNMLTPRWVARKPLPKNRKKKKNPLLSGIRTVTQPAETLRVHSSPCPSGLAEPS